MPLITFEVGTLTDEVKQELIEKLTAVSSEVTGIPKESFFVAIRELPDENIAIGGVTVRDLKRRYGK
jgi:4-oxalocrotonate tautomerase